MYIFANFKAYLDFAETNILVSQLLQSTVADNDDDTVVLFPSLLAFSEVEKACRGTALSVGVQHVGDGASPARTGDISPAQAMDAGATYALIGHSERRHMFGESDAMIAAQCTAAAQAGVIPVLCIGETADELAQGKTKARLSEQLGAVTALPSDAQYIIAYEPVWAIQGSGSGKVCEPEVVADVHAYIRDILATYTDMYVPILFGGSVKAENVVSYTSLPNVDGVLVGSASTKLETFEALVTAIHT